MLLTHNVPMRLVLALIAISVALGACAKPKAAVVVEPAVLQVPSPPPRVIVPPDEPDPGPLLDEVDAYEPKARPRPAPAKPASPPKPGEAPPPATVEPPRPNPVTPPAATLLQPELPTSSQEVQRAVNQRLDQAKANLEQGGLPYPQRRREGPVRHGEAVHGSGPAGHHRQEPRIRWQACREGREHRGGPGRTLTFGQVPEPQRFHGFPPPIASALKEGHNIL